MSAVNPYSVLAAGYDLVMEHVDYRRWAQYIDALIQRFHPDAVTVLELGCGTGSLALELNRMGRYRYAGTDGVPEMVRVARAKAKREDADLQFGVADFTDFHLDRPVDALLLVYDGLNYCTDLVRVARVFDCAFEALKPGGILVFDQSTPVNSVENQAYFEDSGEAEGFSFDRTSTYDPETRIHTTIFEMGFQGHSFREEHLQRAYDIEEIRPLVEEAGLVVECILDGFSDSSATARTERAHWVVRRPA